MAGQLECLKLVIEWMHRQQLEVNLAELGRQDGRTAVHWAARNGRASCLRWLCENAVELGVEIEGRTADGSTPARIQRGVCERAGAAGTTPLMLCCYGGNPECCRMLIEEFGSKTFILQLEYHFMLPVGADPLKQNHWGCNCSHWAAMSNGTEAVPICGLLHEQFQVKFDSAQTEGHTPLDKAAMRGCSAVVTCIGCLLRLTAFGTGSVAAIE